MNKYCVNCDNHLYVKARDRHVCTPHTELKTNYVTGAQELGTVFMECAAYNKEGQCPRFVHTNWIMRLWRRIRDN